MNGTFRSVQSMSFSTCIYVFIYEYIYSSLASQTFAFMSKFSTLSRKNHAHHCASSLVYLVRDLWHGLDGTTIVGSFGVF